MPISKFYTGRQLANAQMRNHKAGCSFEIFLILVLVVVVIVGLIQLFGPALWLLFS